MPSPGAAATAAAAGARSLSSGSYPSGQSSRSASQHIEARGGDEQGREDGGAGRYPTRVSARGDGRSSPTPASVTPIASGGISHHHHQQQQRSGSSGGRGARAATMSSLLDTTALTSSTSTPSGEIGGRAMAHLLDSVASSTASSPATGRQTPPEAAGRRTGAGGRGGAHNEKQTYQPQHRHLQQQQQQKSDVKGGWDATAPVTRHSRRAQPDVDARTLDSTPAQWSRTPPQAQRKPTRTTAAAGASASSSPPPPPLASSSRRAQRSGHHHQPASGAQRYGGSDTDTPTPPRVARFDSPDDSTPSPYSRGAERGEEEEEEEEDASTFYSQDGENEGVDDDDSNSRRRSSRYGHGGNWASPSEVLQLRSMFQEVTARYQREQARLEAELHKAQEECRAYASERASVQSLQRAYAEGLDLCARAKRQQAQWEEERALQQLQLEKVLVENQRLQLFIAKKQKLHTASQGHMRRGGRTPTESQERVRAVVDGMTAGAVRGAAEEGEGTASLSPVTPLYGPSVTPSATAAAAALDPAARPTTAPPLAPHAAPQRLAGGGYDPISFPAGSYSALASTANFLHTHEGEGRRSGGDSDAVQGSPYAVLSAESTPGPRQPQQQQQHSQLQKTTTVDSGSVVVADHTQLPVQSLKDTATRTEVTAVSPSTEASASNLSASPSPLLHDSAQSPRSDQHQQHHQHRSSSLVTPSPSHSGAATATTASSPTGEDAALDETATGGGHSRPLRTARYEHRSADAAAADAAAADLRDGRGGNIDEENPQEQNTDAETGDGATSAEFDPSYARGVNDISTSGTSRGSNLSATAAAAAAASALVVGKLMDAQAQLQQLRRHDLNSDAMLTSDTLRDIRLTNTTQSGDSRRDTLTTNTNRHSSGPLDATAAAAAAAAVNTRRAAAAAAAATTTTTTTTPSLGSTAGTNVSTSTWSLQYLYQLPRSPAEALQEEVRMLKELQRLTEENGVLEARLQHVLAVKDMDCDQREQQQLRLAQEHEQARRSAAHWELTAHQLESEVATLRARCAEQRDSMDAVLEAARRQQQQAQSRLVELEASCRAALTAAREETCVRLAALRKAWADAVNAKQQHQQQQQQRSWSDGEEEAAAEARNGSSPAGATTRNRLQATIDTLTAELHTLKAAHTELQDRQHALESEARLHQQHAGGTLHRLQDALDRAVEERNGAALRIEVLEAEVERLREAAATREACMRATEERLRLATAELTAQAEQLVDAAAWQARAVSAEEETETQRSFYEREINVYRTAACAMQERHHAEMESAVRRYEKLVTRFEALKLRLSGVLTGCVAVGMSGDKATRRRGGNTGEKSASNAADNSPNVTKVRGRQGDGDTGEGSGDHDGRRGGGEVRILSGEGESPATAQLACDSVAALRASVATTDQIVKSLNRGASSAF